MIFLVIFENNVHGKIFTHADAHIDIIAAFRIIMCMGHLPTNLVEDHLTNFRRHRS